jgi:hypothetical protein
MEPFQDDMLSRRLDELTHQMRMLSLGFTTFQLEQRSQRSADRWDLAEDTQKALKEMLTTQQAVLEHQRTINGRLAMYVEQQTAINQAVQALLARSLPPADPPAAPPAP